MSWCYDCSKEFDLEERGSKCPKGHDLLCDEPCPNVVGPTGAVVSYRDDIRCIEPVGHPDRISCGGPNGPCWDASLRTQRRVAALQAVNRQLPVDP